ncbi:unnamed protein product [Phyllotreta striolata]|uniref:Smoothelin domain-containing protein n=1 Tax=Phyllotreta striolata TaxID=444603 RepID=A0A9N9TMY7_PHYSR|nr:unnamed protein product [Phyllotreta striolata]
MSTETANLAQIQDEDVLRKMWADADDFGRKKEIRTHMYKLREERLKEFYRSAESNETKTTSTSASTKATSQKTTQQDSMHADALVDQSFASFKSKEVRDSESPTRDIQYKLPETNEWQTSIRQETSPDGRTKTVEATAGVEGTQKIDGGRVDFAAKTARISSSYQDGNTKSSKNVYAASESAVTRSEPLEKVVTETETLPDGTVVTTTRYSASAGASSKSTSSTKVVQSSTTQYEEDGGQYGRAIEEQTKRSRDLVEENEGNKMSHIIRTSTEDRDIAGARKTTTSEFPAQIVEETRFRTKSPLKEDSKYTKHSAISEFSTQKNEEIRTKTSSHHQKEESSTRKSTINEFPVQNKEETYIITKSPQKYDSKCTKQTEFSTQKNQEILYHQKDDTTTKKTATSEFPAQKKEETPTRSKSPQKEDSKYTKHTAVSEFSTQKNEEIQSKTTTHHKEDATTKKTTISEFPAQKKEETPTRAKSPQKEDSKYTKHTTISEFPAQKKDETPTRTRSPQKADTTYRSDYTNRKISVEMSAAHDKFARSLRTVSPDRVARKPSSSSPERSRHFSRFTSNETITICGADEDEEAAKSRRKITDRSPSSPLEERRPSEVRRSGSFRSPSPTKRVLKRTDTYEERCREILGIVGQSDRRGSLERAGKRGSFRKQRDDAGSPTKNQGGSKETAFVADKTKEITEFPSQRRFSSKENVTTATVEYVDDVKTVSKDDKSRKITEFPSQKRTSSENVTEVSSRTRFSNEENVNREDTEDRNDVQRQEITEFPSQKRFSSKETITTEDSTTRDVQRQKITKFPSQRKEENVTTTTVEIVDDIKGVAKDDKSRKITEFPSQKRFSSKETITTEDSTTKDVQKQKITKFPSQRKEESETTTTVEIVEDFKGIAKDDKSRKITEFPSQKRFSSKETITKEDVTTTKDVQKQKITEIPSQKRISSKEILTTTTVEFVDDVKSVKKDDKSRKITEFPSQKRLPSKEILTTTTSDLISQQAETVRDVQKQKIKEFPSQKRYSPKENVTIESTGGLQQQKVTEFSQQKRFSSKENVITTEDKSKTGRRITEFPSQKRFPSKETTTNTEEAIKKTKKEPTPSKLSELPSQKPKNTKPKIDKPATKRPDLTEFPAQKRPQSKESPKPQTNETTTNRTRIEEPKKPKKPDTNSKFIKAEKGQPTDPKPTKKPTTTSEEFIKREQQSTPAEEPQRTAKFEPINYSGRTPVEEPVCIKRIINTTCPEDEHHKHRKSTKPDHIVVDLKRSKSSREPTPNGVYPVPSSSPENQLPRLPDEILEPDDVTAKPAKLSEVPLVEQDDFDQITEIVDHQVITKRDRVDKTDESLFSLNKKIDLFSRTHQKPAPKDVGVPQRVDKLGVEAPDRPKSPRCRFNEDLEKPVSLENLYETTPKKTILSPAGRLRSTESIKKARELFENMAKEGTADVRATRRSSCTNERERSRSNSPKKDGETPGKDGTPHYMLPLEKHKHTPNEPAFHPRFHHEAVKDNETPHYMLPLDKHDKHTPITDLDSCAQHHHETIKDNETPHYMLPLEKHKHTTSGSNSRLHHHHETIKDNETPHYMLPLEKHKHTPNEPAFHPRFHHEAVKDNETPHYMLPLDKHHEHTPITDLDCCPHAHHETIKDNETPHYMLPMEKHRHTPNEPAFHPRFHHEAAKDNETPHYMLPLEKHKHTSSGSNSRLEHHHETIKDNETPHYMLPLEKHKHTSSGSNSRLEHHHETIKDNETPHYMLPLEKHHKHTPDNATAHQHTPRKDSEANKENETPHYMLPLDKRNKPHYMQPLDRSTHSQSESKSNKFGVTLRKTAPKSGNLASTDVRISLQNRFGNLETLSQEVIEEIYEIEVLEQLLQIVYNYEVRRVIRTQIRLVRKLTSENRLEIYVEEKKRSRSIESEEKTNKTATYTRKSSPERTPSPAKSDSSARSAFVAKKTKEIEAKRTKDSPRNADKDERIAIRTSEKQEYRKTTRQVGTDSITSSYGVGPTDKNGAPLFGLKALRSQREDNTTTKVQGTFVSGEYYSENGQEPVGQITVTEYSNDPKDLGSDAPSTGKDFITSVTTTQKFGYDDAPSLKSLGKQQSGRKPYGRVENTDGTLTKERRNSVKAISQKFIDSTVESLKSERQPAYPKAGLILRTSSFKDSKLDATKSDNSTDVVTSTKTSTSSGSFLTNRTAVSGVQDVISRMKTDEHRSGDSIEDAEARNLLNRFLGSQVLLTGMESMNTNVKTSPTGVVTRKTVKITKSTKDGDKTETKSFVFQGPITEEELENIWDQKTLRLLLEQSTDYEERRIIRNRLRRVMAEQEACAELVQQASGDQPTTARADTTEETVVVEKSSEECPTTATKTQVTRVTTTQQQVTKKPLSPFAKFRQLDKQNSLNTPPRTSN